MFQLSIHNIVQFASLIIYIILISLVLYSKRAKLKRLFIIFLVAAAGMSRTPMNMTTNAADKTIVSTLFFIAITIGYKQRPLKNLSYYLLYHSNNLRIEK